jgi:MoaA/NifB/PqqE/SkfB family radical SAM enzyme/glycosyltransferase involved in cell wall biosynthesis
MILPKEIVIEITNKCNLNCKFCFNNREFIKDKDLSKNNVYSILKDVKKSNIKAVRFSGGEPFLHPDLKFFLRFAHELGLYVILNTNSLLIDKNNQAFFKYVDLVLISLHNFENFQLIKTKLKLIENYNSKIMLCTILTRENINNLELFYKKIKDLKNKNFCEWFLLRKIQFNNENYSKTVQEIKIAYNNIIKFNKKYDLNITINNAIPFCSTNDDLASVCKGGENDSGYTRLIINLIGDYKLDYNGIKIDNINNKKILDIWFNNEILENRMKINENCKKCYYWNKCKGGFLQDKKLINPLNVKLLASVIIPTFNDSKRLKLLVNSLENQSINNFEIIIVDDGSTDDTKKICKDLMRNSKLKISYYYLDNTNIFGAGIARNYGSIKAKSEILIFLDQDNVTYHNLIKNYIDEHKKNNIILGYYSGYKDSEYHYNFKKLEDYVKLNKKLKQYLKDFRHNLFITRNVMISDIWKNFVSANFSIKKNLFVKYKFDERYNLWGCEDIDLGYRLIKDNRKVIFSLKCISFNSSKERFLTVRKFQSLIPNLIKFYNKYKTEDIKQYINERFSNTPKEIRKNSKLDFDDKSSTFTFIYKS